jgi:hypothetical protein
MLGLDAVDPVGAKTRDQGRTFGAPRLTAPGR